MNLCANESLVEDCKSQEGAYSYYRCRCVPCLNYLHLCRDTQQARPLQHQKCASWRCWNRPPRICISHASGLFRQSCIGDWVCNRDTRCPFAARHFIISVGPNKKDLCRECSIDPCRNSRQSSWPRRPTGKAQLFKRFMQEKKNIMDRPR